MQLGRPIQTRFRCASTYRLKLAAYSKSLTHYTKGTPSPRKEAPTACRHPVSGTVSLPLSGCFSPFPHGTMRYRSPRSILPWRVVPPASHKVSRVSWYSGSQPSCSAFRLRDFYPLRSTFPGSSTRPDSNYAGPQPQ